MFKSTLIFIVFHLCSCNIIVGQDCPSPKTKSFLESTKIKASHGIGNLWYDHAPFTPFIYPKDRNVSALLSGSIWLSGKTNDGKLKVISQTNGQYADRTAWSAGPNKDAASCINWDKTFHAKDEQIKSFLEDLQDGQIDEVIPNSILAWPGNGNPYFENVYGFSIPNTTYGFAPFIDSNSDGIYNPYSGDYPDIKGATEMSWSVMNDFFNGINLEPMGIELQVSAYSFSNHEAALENSIIYDLKFINRSGEKLNEMVLSLWVRPSLGCNVDDFIGCHPQNNLAFVYNQDETDGSLGDSCPNGVNTYGDEIPVIGFKLLQGLKTTSGAELDLQSFIYYVGGNCDLPFGQLTPDHENPNQINHLMNGRWGDGSPMTHGGSGIGDSIITNYAFPSLPNDKDGWSLCTANLPICPYHMLMNFGPFELDNNEYNTMTFSVTGVENVPHPCPDINPLIDRTNLVKDWWDNRVINGNIKVDEQLLNPLKVHPNPATQMIRLSIEGDEKISEIIICNLQSQILQKTQVDNQKSLDLRCDELIPGVYFIRVRLTNGLMLIEKLIIN